MSTLQGLLTGKVGLVTGVANERSIADERPIPPCVGEHDRPSASARDALLTPLGANRGFDLYISARHVSYEGRNRCAS